VTTCARETVHAHHDWSQVPALHDAHLQDGSELGCQSSNYLASCVDQAKTEADGRDVLYAEQARLTHAHIERVAVRGAGALLQTPCVGPGRGAGVTLISDDMVLVMMNKTRAPDGLLGFSSRSK